MALAPFFSRVSDAIVGIANVTRDELDVLLADSVVHLELGSRTTEGEMRDGAVLAGDLLARLYPTLSVSGPSEIVQVVTERMMQVNPALELVDHPGSSARARLVFGGSTPDASAILATASGWTVHIDQVVESPRPPSSFAALAAACLGVAEVFRSVFAPALQGKGRLGRQPGWFDLIGGTTEQIDEDANVAGTDLGPVHLAGAGAVGQACVLALSTAGVLGNLTVVDPETITMPNLQRYVLSTVEHVGSRKVDVVNSVMTSHGWTVNAVASPWGASQDAWPHRELVLTALDSARDRISVAAGLHRRIYNAWTQPADLGWSRHEQFGIEPCLACLYYPTHQRPSDDEQVAKALGEHRLRILSYFVSRVPVGAPLPIVSQSAELQPPANAGDWVARSLLDDLVARGVVPEEAMSNWSAATIDTLYSDGICGGGIVGVDARRLGADVVVPLAHQSVLAGILLALQPVIAANPKLVARRPAAIESRLDLLSGLPQIASRPRQRTPGCICSDATYRGV